MKNRTLVLAILAVVLLAAAYLVMQKPGEHSRASGTGDLLVAVDSSSADRIEMISPGSAVVLAKRSGEWRIEQPNAFRADQAAVASFLHALKALSVSSVVSDRPEKRALFRVDSAGTVVRVSSGGTEQAAIVLGKPGTVYTERYARVASSNEVVLVESPPGTDLSRSLRDWRDRTVFSRPREQVTNIVFQYGDTTFTLAFRDSAWSIGAARANADVVNGLLSALCTLQADDFADSITVPGPRVTALVSTGGEQLRFAFQRSSGKYLVQTSASPQWYMLEPWKANQILIRETQLTDAKR